MFTTADWTQPQIGGLLSEIIEKEERQLRAPKPRVPVQHIWESETLKGRASLWKEVAPRPQPGNMMEMTRSKCAAPRTKKLWHRSASSAVPRRRCHGWRHCC